ncbi:MAG TPA: peptidyl-prolyl cis-trans isomerase, partial [Anaeromyxobacteraceae bacterium]|nr:peptidyl-prolyl cis-trans isomerase [Anaeromyxobacteraceae bacterium]
MPTLPLLVLALAAGAPDPTVATVDGRPITASAVSARQERVRRQGFSASASETVDRLVEDALLEADARKQGLARDPAVLAAIDAERRALAAERFLDAEFAKLEPDEAQLREMFHGSADSVRTRAVVVASREAAQAVVERLKKGATWATEARSSLDPRSREKAGDQGLQNRLQLDPAFAEIAFGAPLHTVVGPVALRMGWAAVEVLERTVATEAEYQAQRGALRERAKAEYRKQGRKHFLSQLRARSGVKIDEAFLRGTGTRLDATREEEAHVVAQVGARKVTYGQVLPGVRKLAGGQAGSHFSGTGVKLELTWAEVDRLLAEEEAVKRGADKDPALAAAFRDVESWNIALEYARRLRASPPAPSAPEVEALYAERRASLMRPGHRTCAHVLAKTRGDAEAAAKRISRGEAFEAVARSASLDRASAEAGGLLGDVHDDRIEEFLRGGPPDATFAAAIRDAAPGAVVGPVESRMGWHLVRCGPHQAAAPAPLAEVAPALA